MASPLDSRGWLIATGRNEAALDGDAIIPLGEEEEAALGPIVAEHFPGGVDVLID